MKLQIKDAGAWRNVASFTRSEEQAFLTAAADLLRALRQPSTQMRVVEADTPLFYCYGPDYIWTPAARKSFF